MLTGTNCFAIASCSFCVEKVSLKLPLGFLVQLDKY